MSYFSPAMVVGTAFLDEVFAQALLADPRRALTNAKIELAPSDWTPFLGGASTITELANVVYRWELESGRTEQPLLVPALEPRSSREGRGKGIAQQREAAILAA